MLRLMLAMVLLMGRTALAHEPRAILSLPQISPCAAAASHPILPQIWRGTYLMAPFTKEQLVLADIVSDASLSAMRVRLHGVQRGSIDLFVLGTTTYVLSAEGGVRQCRMLGDTGWRPLPKDWLSPQSTCTGAAPVGETSTEGWKTPIAPEPASYRLWYKRSDQSPFRILFPFASDRLPPLSRFALSYQTRFEMLQESGLAAIAATCNNSSPPPRGSARHALRALLGSMSDSPYQAADELSRLMPELDSRCPAVAFPQWPAALAMTGLMTPYDSDEDPYQTEILYDWTVPGQRTRTFGGPEAGITAQDSLLLGAHGFTITHYRQRPPVCRAVLPGTIRPDWISRAPCHCAGTINGTTPLSPDGTTRILVCPLASPRVAWSWYGPSGRPTVFMVTAAPGDEGKRQFAVLDYRQWLPGEPFSRSAFDRPPQCAAAKNVRKAPPHAKQCSTCHLGLRPPH